MTAARQHGLMAAPVYLMADFGKGPRMYCHRKAGPPNNAMLAALDYVKRECRAWWLVETESADAARLLITASQRPLRGQEWHGAHGLVGRILASGGAATEKGSKS